MVESSGAIAVMGGIAGRGGRGCEYAMFTRHGGQSEGLFGSLNIALQLGDDPAAVLENRRRVKELLRVDRLLSARQVHGDGIYRLTEPLSEDRQVDGFDALITDRPGVGLMIQQADCQAVLLFDPVQGVIGAVHCGWRGSVQQLAPRVVETMAKQYGTAPADLQAVISPSLGPCCAEFVNHRQELPDHFRPFMVRDNHFDFWRITRSQLVEAGLVEQHIAAAEVCTCCSDGYFSYRRASRLSRGITGRQCSVILLKDNAG